MSQRTREAVGIYTDLLHRIEAAYAQRDFSGYEDCVRVPHWIATEGRLRCIRDRDALWTLFDSFTEFLRSNRIIDMARVTGPCDFVRDDMIRGSHMTHLINESGMRVQAPYLNRSILRLSRDGAWQVAGSHAAIQERSWPALAFAATAKPAKESS